MNSLFVGFFSFVFLLGMSSVSSRTVTPAKPVPPPEPVIVEQPLPPAVVPVADTTKGIVDLGEKGDALVQKSLIQPLSATNKIDKDMFSRCGSGFYYTNDDTITPDNDYYHGQIWFSIGCGSSNMIVKFRVNAAETVLQVLNAKTGTYVTPVEWLSTYQNTAGNF